MRKVIVVLVIVLVISLLGSLFLKEKSPIVSMVCKKTASSDCNFDRCGFCENRVEADVGWPSSEAKEFYGCPIPINKRKMSGGHICKKINNQCRLQKTWRTTACEVLLGTYIENKEAEKMGKTKSIYVDIFGK